MSDCKLVLPAYLDSFKTLADKSVKLTFTTQEVNEEQGKAMFSFRGAFGNLLFVTRDVKQVEVPPTPSAPEWGDYKTPSKRLRDVLFVWWKHRIEGSKDDPGFEAFYTQRMEGFISAVKAKLE